MYVLMDADGEMHPPKDEERREIALTPAEVAGLRQRVMIDARAMVARGMPLSTGFLRQLQMPASLVAAVAACEAAGTRPTPATMMGISVLATTVKTKTKKGYFNIKAIKQEVASTGKAKAYFLVEWEGYHPSWEKWRVTGRVGDPLETWEALGVVRGSIAFEQWRA